MKKLFMTMLTFLACGTAFALPIGNPSDASLLCDGFIWEGHCGDPCDPYITWCDAFSMRVGFYGDYVFNRHLEVDSSADDSDIDTTRINTNAALIVANFWDRLDIFTTLGATNFFFDTGSSTFGDPTNLRFYLETATSFSWSLGARATVWELGCTSLGIEGQYFRTHPDVRYVDISVSEYPNNVDMKYHEWQIGVGISHRINMLVPYFGIKWSRAKADFDNASVVIIPEITTAQLHDLENKKSFGYAIGVSLIDCEKASLTVEARFRDEKAVHVNGQIRF